MFVWVRFPSLVLKRGSEATMIQKKVRVNLYIVVTPKDPKLLFFMDEQLSWIEQCPSKASVIGSNPISFTIRTFSSVGQSTALIMRRSMVRVHQGPPKNKYEKACLIQLFFVYLHSKCVGVPTKYKPLKHKTNELFRIKKPFPSRTKRVKL